VTFEVDIGVCFSVVFPIFFLGVIFGGGAWGRKKVTIKESIKESFLETF
jgi:hypothetical protein